MRTMTRLLLVLVFLAFAALTALAVVEHGVIGIFTFQFQTSAGWQVLVDLVIALALVLVWLVQDARAQGRNPWPWVAATLALGSFGPLVYLLTRRPPVR
jgi:hypothetical protein